MSNVDEKIVYETNNVAIRRITHNFLNPPRVTWQLYTKDAAGMLETHIASTCIDPGNFDKWVIRKLKGIMQRRYARALTLGTECSKVRNEGHYYRDILDKETA